ncbi:putative sulfate transporter, partial [Operophtera brumata]
MSSPSKHRSKKQTRCKRLLHKRIPVTRWLSEYNSEKAIADLIAGITDGLYSSFVGCFVYVVFGSCKDITLGPTALLALMTYQQIQGRNADYAVLLCFMSGVVQLVMGILHLAVSQLKGLLGLQFKSGGFIDTLKKVFINLPNAKLADSCLGVSCIAILLLMRKTLWLLSTSRNAIVVVFCSLMAFFFESNYGESPFKLTGTVKDGLPSLTVPPFSTEVDASGDSIDATQELLTLSLTNILGSFVGAMPITGSFSRSAVNHASGVATQFGGLYTGNDTYSFDGSAGPG